GPLCRAPRHMPPERLDVELVLSDAGNHHTNAELTVGGPFMVGLRRSFPRTAPNRLYALCQTAAEVCGRDVRPTLPRRVAGGRLPGADHRDPRRRGHLRPRPRRPDEQQTAQGTGREPTAAAL